MSKAEFEKQVTRCHRCGTSKGLEDKGVYISWFFNHGENYNKIIVWFHNKECKVEWEKIHQVIYETMEYSDEIGIVPMSDLEPFGKKNTDEI